MQKYTESINPKVSKTTNGKTMMLSKYSIWFIKKSKFIKEQEAKGLLSNLGIRTSFSKIPLLGDILFQKQFYKRIVYKNNVILLSKMWRK